ncbi:carbon dioxide concentrating mechanism protein CcmM [Paenibacillus taihuensis]|uniref:Carbon dioxide concentrating mechanism protein CcmM n=1 Tax=Paenibacillus taihuensis TaxID=1156355 RepID=A0A3D9S5N0_9BACL|nr:carbonate dehydratase [Paenibacillus taihuensis]REE83872.1 carbon dioxide concentrating mechanism protein CcmM [Paenibacillus taihuensis]
MYNDFNHLPSGPYNMFARYISPNPRTTINPVPRFPAIHYTAFLSPFSCVIGDVHIHENVYVAPSATLRADEGTPFSIGSNSNIQDGAILHGLANETLQVGDRRYSIYIGNNVSIAHAAIIHGPCYIGDDTFVSFKSIVFNAVVGRGSYISMDAVVTNGVHLAPHRFVPPGAHIDTQAKADSLSSVPKDSEEFAQEVIRVNNEFPPSYHFLFGTHRCSCGVTYNQDRLIK